MRKILYILLLSFLISACTKPLGDVDVFTPSSEAPSEFDISLIQLADNKMVVNWTRSNFASSYTLFYGIDQNDLDQKVNNAVSPYILSNLKNGQKYFFKVTSANSNGTAESTVKEKIFYKKPEAFEIKNISSMAGFTTIEWTASQFTEAYIIQVGSAPGVYDVMQAPAGKNDTSVIFPNALLDPSETYYFRMTATNPAGNKNSTNEYEYGPEDPPTVPTNFTAVVDPADRFICKVSWTAPASVGTKVYTLMSSTTNGATPPGDATIAYQGEGLLTNIEINDRTYFWVRATTAYGDSPWTTSVNCANPKASVDSLSAVASSGQSALSWTGTNADTYVVEYGTAANSITTLVGEYPSSVTAYTVTGLTNGQTYHFRVTAKNAKSSGSRTTSSAPANTLPTISVGNTTTQISVGGSEVRYRVTIADAEDTLECTSTNLSITSTDPIAFTPANATFEADGAQCIIKITPNPGAQGRYTLSAVVKDNNAGQRTTTIYALVLPAAKGIYSNRKRVSTYNGYAIELRKADNQTQSFGYNTNDTLNTTAINTFLGADTIAYVTKWYDQSGSGNNLVENDNAKQLIYSRSTSNIEFSNSRYLTVPYSVAQGLRSLYLQTYYILAQSQPESPVVTWLESPTNNGFYLLRDTTNGNEWKTVTTDGALSTNTVSNRQNTSTERLTLVFNGASKENLKLKAGTNAAVVSSGTPYIEPGAATPLTLGFGNIGGMDTYYNGRILDLFIFSNELTDLQQADINRL